MKLNVATVLLWLAASSAPLPAEPPSAGPAAPSLTRPKGAAQAVDARGFIHRWLVLEPVPVEGRLTETSVEAALKLASLPDSPVRDGAKVSVNGNEYAWHALDTANYNLNLYHFARALSRPTSNVLFWIETTIETPREMTNVRLAIGSNAASRWWLNGDAVIALNDDRQSVIDDGVSHRVTLREGRNVIRAAVINGGGATDFCARFIDESGKPIVGLTASLPDHLTR
jgi:hypothetical protein